MSKTSKRPTIGNRKPSEVKEKTKQARTAVAPLPEFPIPMIDGVVNPLIASGRMKRALCVALALKTTDDELLCQAVRQAGVCQKSGMNVANLNTEPLPSNEQSGRGYALRFARKQQDTYAAAKPEAVAACTPFAEKLIHALTKGELEVVRQKAMAEFTSKKAELLDKQKEAAEKAKKKAEAKKAGVKPSKKSGAKPTLKAASKKSADSKA